jgi:DNA-binding transcriptional LysR family regulator
MGKYNDPEFHHLEFIIALAEAGTFAAAGDRANTAPSSMNRQVRELENRLGVQIFEPGSAVLTAAGECFLVYAHRALPDRDEVVDAAIAIHQASMKPFRLGFSPFVDKCVLATVSETYRHHFPKGMISPEPGDTNDLLERLKAGELDAALVTLPLAPDGYQVQPIMHEPLFVCLRKDDPLAEYDELPPASLNGRLAIFSDPRHHPLAHARLLELLAEQGIEPRISPPTFNNEHVQWMVREGLCLALIAQHEKVQEGLICKPIQGVHWTIDSAIVYQPQNGQKALPVLLRDLEQRFSVATEKKRPRSVKNGEQQKQLPFGGTPRKANE